MRRRSLLRGGLAALTATPMMRAAWAQVGDRADPEAAAARIRAFVELACEHWRIPGAAVAVVYQGRPLLAAGFGVRNSLTRNPVDAHTAFCIGSCSKAYTSCAAAILVDEGRIGWDDPVKGVYPELALYDPAIAAQVSLRDLLSHRVGLSRAFIGEYGSDLSHAEVLARAAAAPKATEFRSRFSYSNLGFAIAADRPALPLRDRGHGGHRGRRPRRFFRRRALRASLSFRRPRPAAACRAVSRRLRGR